MIPQIQEINFPDYVTLHQATVNFATMGDRTISTQVRIDGDRVPEFGVTENGVFKPMELVFRGERFILPVREPQARKDNSTRNSLIDLNFQSWVVYQLKRYFFVEMASTTSGTAIADKYEASLVLNLENFVDAFNLVLDHYFNGTIQISLFQQGQGIYSTDTVAIDINYSKIWDVLQKVYELYNVRWWIEYNSTTHTYYIMMGYESPAIDDHDFSYGYQGGLISFERQVQEEVTNILLGRGGEKNLPYRYFKRVDEQNPGWTADPDAIPELANIYFERLRDINFRWYVRGWMQNSHRDKTWENAGYTYPTYGISQSSPYYWAYLKGRTDTKFDPVEYVQDTDSIDIYGEMWGALDNNDDIYPTIQGVNPPNDNPDVGFVDEVVGVSQIVTDDIQEYTQNAAVETTIKDIHHSEPGSIVTHYVLYSETFTIAAGDTGNITYHPLAKDSVWPAYVSYNTSESSVEVIRESDFQAISTTNSFDTAVNTGAIAGIPAGTYRLRLNLVLNCTGPATRVTGTFGIENIVLTTSAINTEAWKPTFDIWVKNIWGTTQGGSESDQTYSERVWGPILGDRVGNQAKLVFSTGPMSISQDYEFTIASYPVPDRTKTYGGVTSEWRITVHKCNAEYQTTGLFIPNASSAQPTAGNKFFFTGIDMPFQYVQWAEERLNAYKATQLEDMSDVTTTWALKLDKVRVHTLEDADLGQLLADRLDSGVLINTTDPRFTHGDVLSLYIQSITWTWNEPTNDNPYLVPDIEVVLADKVVAVKSPIAELSEEVNVISATYVQTPDVESVVRRVAGALYLKKTGESDTSSSPTSFSSKVTSSKFKKGSIGGQGWGFYEDNSPAFDVPTQSGLVDDGSTDSKAVLEVDKLVVRDELHVNELVVNQVSYQGGKEIISAAAMEVSMVRETNNSYICYFDQKQNTVVNLFQVNDIAYGQVWNADNSELRSYKMVVTAVDSNSITLSKGTRYGSGAPQVGDKIVQYGNTTNTSRQYVIFRDVIGGGYERMISGLNSPSASGTEYYFAGREGNSSPRWFVGQKTNGEYAEWVNGHLNIKGGITVTSGSSGMSNFSEYSDLTNSITSVSNSLTTFLQTTYPSDKQGLQDGMIQTYSGTSAPTWTDDNSKHVGDIWYDQTNQITKRFSEQYTWEPLTDGTAVTAEALARTKCRVFYGQPTVPYSQNDLWFNNGKVYRATTGRTTGSFNSSEWEEAILLNANDKAEVKREWQKIHGEPNVTGSPSDKGSYITTKNIVESAGYGAEENVVLTYDGYTLTYGSSNTDILRYKASGTAAFDAAYNALKTYLTTYTLYDNQEEWANGYDPDEMTRLLTAYYTAQTEFLANAQFSVVSDLEYLKAALPQGASTDIEGGVVLSTILGVRDENNYVTAGMNGNVGNGNPMLWAGSSNASTINNAKWRVYKDGRMVLCDSSGGNFTVIDGNTYTLSDVFGADASKALTGGSATGSEPLVDGGGPFVVTISNNVQTNLVTDQDGTFAFPSITLSGLVTRSGPEQRVTVYSTVITLKVDGQEVSSMSNSSVQVDSGFSDTITGVQMFLPAGTHTISVEGVFYGEHYSPDPSFTTNFTAGVTYGASSGTLIVNQKKAHLCSNGFILGKSNVEYMQATVDSNGMNFVARSGNAGVKVYNGVLKLLLNGSWYTASEDGGYLKLTSTAE